jgi:hypothetical protein
MSNLIKRHEDQIRNLIDDLHLKGWARFSRDCLRHWYQQDRMSKTVWRDISERLPEDWTAKDVTVLEYQDDILLFENSCTSKLADLI